MILVAKIKSFWPLTNTYTYNKNAAANEKLAPIRSNKNKLNEMRCRSLGSPILAILPDVWLYISYKKNLNIT